MLQKIKNAKNTHGGKRKGAGRPAGLVKQPTQTVRIPAHLTTRIKDMVATMQLPLYSSRVQAGLPSSADSHIEDNIDLSAYLVKHPHNTFLVRATGDSMIEAGIQDGAMLVVDRNMEPTNGKIVIASLDGYLTVKYLRIGKDRSFLAPANKNYPDIPIDGSANVAILGVVTSSTNIY